MDWSYTPILGSSSYLTFASGNLMNLKMPCIINAQKIAKVEQSTVEGDAIALIATAVSSSVTIVILALGMLLLSFIRPLLENETFETASNYLLPALFGSMTLGLFASSSAGSKVVVGGIKGVIPVLVIISAVCIFARIAGFAGMILGLVGFMILLMLPVAIITSRILWKKGIIKVVDKEAK